MRHLLKKGIISIISIYIIIFIPGSASAQFFHGPESVTYDILNSRYLISNVGNGDIVQISDAGDTTFFDRTLARTLGMVIVDDILYVADISGIVTFDLTTDTKISTISIPGMIELNDITADTSGYLYITDSSGGKVYRMKISDHSFIEIISGLNIPNGILFDARKNRVLFCQFIVNAPIKQIDPDDLSVTTILTTSYSYFDGLTLDSCGNIYVSCWGNNAIYRYDQEFSLPAELISGGHSGPADIFCNQIDNILAVPNYYSGIVNFIPITPTHTDELSVQTPRTFSLWQNYPNPFNPVTIIKYQLSELSFISLKVYDIIGSEIVNLVNETQGPGLYEIKFNGKNLNSGTYFYRIKAENKIQTKKMMLLK